MTFTKVARVIAYFLCISGILSIIVGLIILFDSTPLNLPNAGIPSIGGIPIGPKLPLIASQGFLMFGAGIIFGVLSDISRSLARASIIIEEGV